MLEFPRTLGRQEILKCLPHQGGNCLLDVMFHVDASRIACESRAHLLELNPYRVNGKLSAATAVEFAAQSFALHASLKRRGVCGNAANKYGYLASVRDLTLTIGNLDECAGALRIEAEEIAVDPGGMLYAFNVQHDGSVIAKGRAVIMLQAELR
jgi:predicted hotdog family 3-hydroxylacyl-ACP dehydratase